MVGISEMLYMAWEDIASHQIRYSELLEDAKSREIIDNDLNKGKSRLMVPLSKVRILENRCKFELNKYKRFMEKFKERIAKLELKNQFLQKYISNIQDYCQSSEIIDDENYNFNRNKCSSHSHSTSGIEIDSPKGQDNEYVNSSHKSKTSSKPFHSSYP